MPIVDVGSGRLHRNLKTEALVEEEDVQNEKRWGRKRRDSDKRKSLSHTQSQSRGEDSPPESNETLPPGSQPHEKEGYGDETEGSTSDVGSKEDSSAVPSQLRRGSAGRIDDRLRQGKKAVWGRHTLRSAGGALRAGSGGEEQEEKGGHWWETGTKYVFQPKLTALELPMAVSPDTSGFIPSPGKSYRGLEWGGGEHRFLNGRGTNVGFIQGHWEARGRKQFFHVVQPGEENIVRGSRVFFLT